MTTIRRSLAGLASATLLTTLGALTAFGAPAAQAAEVHTAADKTISAALSWAETADAATSLTAATSICDTQLKPQALLSYTAWEWQFPACGPSLQGCAQKAYDNGKPALVTTDAEIYDCHTWSGIPDYLPW
jgi:hypothetical protein